MIVAEKEEETLVENRRVVKFLVGVASAERRDGGIEDGGVAHAGVEITGGERARHAAGGAGARPRCARNDRRVAFVLRAHFARQVDLRPGDVGMHVHAARHDDETRRIDDAIRPSVLFAGRGDDFAVADPKILHDAVKVVEGVVNRAAGDFQERGHRAPVDASDPFKACSSRSRSNQEC